MKTPALVVGILLTLLCVVLLASVILLRFVGQRQLRRRGINNPVRFDTGSRILVTAYGVGAVVGLGMIWLGSQ